MLKKFYIKNKYYLSLALFLALVFLYFLNYFFRYDVYELKSQDMIETLNFSGKTVAIDKVNLGFKEGGIVKNIYKKPGDEVKRGEFLASLDSDEVELEIERVDSEINLTKKKLTQLLAGVSSEEINFFEARVESAKIDLENALQDFENKKIEAENSSKQSIEYLINFMDVVVLEAENAVNVLNSIYQPSNKFKSFFFIRDFEKKSNAEWQIIFTRDAFDKIKSDYKLLKGRDYDVDLMDLISNFKVNLEIIRVSLEKTSEAVNTAVVYGDLSIDEFKINLIEARESINKIQAEILNREQAVNLNSIQNDTILSNAKGVVDLKRTALKESELELSMKKLKPRSVEIEVYEAQIKKFVALKKLLKQKVKNNMLLAPSDGILESLDISIGSVVKVGEKYLTMVLPFNFQVMVLVDESEFKKINIGDNASLSFGLDGVNQNIKASVVGLYIEDLNGNDLYKVYISPNDDIDLSLGVDVDVNVYSVLKKQALIIPRKSIRINDGVKKVLLMENGVKKLIEINTGLESGDFVEVISGLYEGDRIIIR